MLIILLLSYTILAFVFWKKKVARLLFLVLVLSVAAAIFIGEEVNDFSIKSLFNVFFIILINSIFILTWKNFTGFKSITCSNSIKVDRLASILFVICSIAFIILLFTSLAVLILVDDINTFKYVEGESAYFYNKLLPFDVHWFMLSTYLYYFSYFLIPLFFYYMSKGNRRRGLICFLLSADIILYGLTFFSRWTITLFVLLYFIFWVALKDSLPAKSVKSMNKGILLFGLLLGGAFTVISISRFSEDTLYENTIPSYSPIQDPSAYQFFDYIGQHNYVGLELLNDYNGEGFGGSYSVSIIRSFVSPFIGLKASNFKDIKERLWKSYYDNFAGLVTYSVYDFGYIGTIFFAFFYYFLFSIKRTTSIKVEDLFKICLWIQLPLCAFFYSQLPYVLFSFLFYIPIRLYLSLK